MLYTPTFYDPEILATYLAPSSLLRKIILLRDPIEVVVAVGTIVRRGVAGGSDEWVFHQSLRSLSYSLTFFTLTLWRISPVSPPPPTPSQTTTSAA
jgi:hypothetical protein